jgi:hypothetical protein
MRGSEWCSCTSAKLGSVFDQLDLTYIDDTCSSAQSTLRYGFSEPYNDISDVALVTPSRQAVVDDYDRSIRGENNRKRRVDIKTTI